MPGHGEIVHYGLSHNLNSTDYEDAWEDFTCGVCDRATVGVVVARLPSAHGRVAWLMCPRCGAPHAFVNGVTSPTPKPGPTIEGLPELVERAYDEARLALGAGSPLGCELTCRKILMYAAIDRAGAEEGEPFVKYIDILQSAGYITAAMTTWVDQIRTRANEATHELPLVDHDRAENTLQFTATLLRLVYEMEHQTRKFTAPSIQPAATS